MLIIVLSHFRGNYYLPDNVVLVDCDTQSKQSAVFHCCVIRGSRLSAVSCKRWFLSGPWRRLESVAERVDERDNSDWLFSLAKNSETFLVFCRHLIKT